MKVKFKASAQIDVPSKHAQIIEKGINVALAIKEGIDNIKKEVDNHGRPPSNNPS